MDQLVRDDLKKSALTAEDVQRVGWYSLPRDGHGRKKLQKILGFTSYDNHDLLKETTEILVLPYPRSNFARVRLYPPLDGVKYLQPSNVAPRAYIPDEVWELREKPHKPLIITEGEKKVLVLHKHGFNTIGLPGVWSFKNTKTGEEDLISDLRAFSWERRTVHIVFDSDSIFNPQVKQAQIELALKLWERGAKVFIVDLPQPTHNKKQGVDDFIAQRGSKAFQEAMNKALPLHKAWPSEYAEEVLKVLSRLDIPQVKTSLLIETLAKGWGISKKTIWELFHVQGKGGKEECWWTPEEKEEALALLKEPRLLEKFLADTSKVYVGREPERVLLKLVLTGRKIKNNVKGTGVVIQGASSVGKSALVETVSYTCQPEDTVKFTRLSANYLLYTTRSLARKILIIYELQGADEATLALRTGLSESTLKVGTVDKNQSGQLTPRENAIDATGMVLVSTSTRSRVGWELGTRVIVLSLEHDPTIATGAYELMANERNEVENLKVWRVADALLDPQNVEDPFAKRLAKLFPRNQERYLRDFQRVLYLIKASALLHQHQRPKDDQGNILATEEDYRIIYDLQPVLFEAIYDIKVEAFIETVKKLKVDPLEWPCRKDVQDNLGISKATIKRRVGKASEFGLIELDEKDGRGDKTKIKVVGEVEKIYPLPSPEEILKLGEPMSQSPEHNEIIKKEVDQPLLNQCEPVNQNGTKTAQRLKMVQMSLSQKLFNENKDLENSAQRLNRNKGFLLEIDEEALSQE